MTADKLLNEQEIVRMRDIAFDEYGALLSVSGKTGTRRICIVASCSELASCINIRPDSGNSDAPVWIGVGTIGRNEPLTYYVARKLIQTLARSAGIKIGTSKLSDCSIRIVGFANG